MNGKLEWLKVKIEYLKDLLNMEISLNHKLTDPSVVKCSQELDKVLVEYEKTRTILKKAA